MLRRQIVTGLRLTAVLTLLLGIAYPLAVTAIAQVGFSDSADGSIVRRDGTPVGSRLIGQAFSDGNGAPLPQYFQPRPSAAADGYDAMSSSGSNLGPSNPDLLASVEERVEDYRDFNGLGTSTEVPVDAVTASGSGLDPHISVDNARLQTSRVAAIRSLSLVSVAELVEGATDEPILGFLGERTVNVVELNLALDRMTAQTGS